MAEAQQDHPISSLETKKKRAIAGLTLRVVLAAVLSLALILSLRGFMNLMNRNKFISQRLDDYPRLHENFLRETQETEALWNASDDKKRAEQAAFLWVWDGGVADEQEKLARIAEIVGAERICVVTGDGEAADALYTLKEAGMDAAYAPLPDGKFIIIGLHDSDIINAAVDVNMDAYFLRHLHAGLPGYVLVLQDGELAICPEDETSRAVLSMVRSMLDSGAIDPAALASEAKQKGQSAAFQSVRNPGGYGFPAQRYILRCAAYSDSDHFVIHAAETAELLRIARKRSWALWYLHVILCILVAIYLWRTRLYNPRKEGRAGLKAALRQAGGMLLIPNILLCMCVFMVQLLSSVNQSAQSAENEVAFLKSVLQLEATRAKSIAGAFDAMYEERAKTAAAILSGNPDLVNMDSLRQLDAALGGTGLRVYDVSGKMTASDDVFQPSSDGELPHAVNRTAPDGGSAGASAQDVSSHASRVYRAILADENGRTTGYLELRAPEADLNRLLKDTRIDEIIGDMHMLDTLHVVVVDSADKKTIRASTYANWVGESAESFGISSSVLYDGYEGMVSFGNELLYTIVFSYDNSLVVVSCEDVPLLYLLGGVAVLFLALALLTDLIFVIGGVRRLYELQAAFALAGEDASWIRYRHPPVREFVRSFLLGVLFLTAVLFFITENSPHGITYHIVRGGWVRGINALTVTTCIMLVSLVTAIHTALDFMLDRLGQYLSPKGKTICGLISSICSYFGAIVVILYALSMFGVNTATLIGGVGATALVFTIGANALISDVVSGIFIIFEGDYTVGDIVTIDDFRGVVTDVTMRTTKLMDLHTRDIRIVSNSVIKDIVNLSRRTSVVLLDIRLSHTIGLAEGEKILREEIANLPRKYPEIIGKPEYWGVVSTPERNSISGKILETVLRVAFYCEEKDRDMLTLSLRRELVWLTNRLLDDDSDVGIEGSRVEGYTDRINKTLEDSDAKNAERKSLRKTIQNMTDSIAQEVRKP